MLDTLYDIPQGELVFEWTVGGSRLEDERVVCEILKEF